MILKTTEIFSKNMIKNKNIDYKKYIKDKKTNGKLSFIVVAFIPIIRLVVWGVIIFLIFAREKDLDILFTYKKGE